MNNNYSELVTSEVLRLANEARIKNSPNLTVAKLLARLSHYTKDKSIILSNGKSLSGKFGSYRGYYEDLLLEYTSEPGPRIETVGQIIEAIKAAILEGIMTGYKGGDYSISGKTLVWTGHPDTTMESMMIVEVAPVDGEAVLVLTEEV